MNVINYLNMGNTLEYSLKFKPGMDITDYVLPRKNVFNTIL